MAVEVEQVPVENQSTAGKWILLFLALMFVAAAVYGYVTTQHRVEKLTKDLGASQAQVVELQKRMQSDEAQEETLGQKLGLTKKELAQRAAHLYDIQVLSQIYRVEPCRLEHGDNSRRIVSRIL